MNIRSSRIITLAIILLGAFAILGAAGAITPASAAAIAINSDAKVANYAQVTLAITPPVGYIDMRFQNESDSLSLSAWEPVATSKRWTMSAVDGIKTVKVQFRNASTITTNINDPLYRDTIILDSIIDTSFNAASASYPGTANFANTASVLSPATAANAVAVYTAGAHAGKTVTVGSFDNGNGDTDIKVLRYNTDGTLDMQYVFQHVGIDSANAVAIQPDGKIVVVGTVSRSAGVTDIFLVRLNDNGTEDAFFGIAGRVDYIGSGKDSGNAVAIQADGKIVVAGTYNSAFPFAWVLRFNADGTKDTTTFAVQGDIAFMGGQANAVALDTSNPLNHKIVVAGTYDNGATGTSAWVMRLNSDGSQDTTFNPAGSSPGHNFFGSNGQHSGNAVAVDPTSHKIVVVGTYNGSQAWVLQLNPDGTLDTTFNFVGDVALDGPVASFGSSVVIQADGKIVVAGTYDFGGGLTSIFAARLNNSGTLATTLLDTTFNYGNYDYAFGIGAKFTGKAVALQPDGKIIVAGIGEANRLLASIPVGSTSMLTLRLHEKTNLLTVTTIGDGTVSAFPGTLTGGTGNFVPGSTIELTATPASGFLGWSGACTNVTGPCIVTMDAAKSVTANFTAPLLNLNVTVAGPGSVNGTVSCLSGTCSFQLPYGTPINLTASQAWYATFVGWGGDCSGTGTCSPALTQNRSVSASFSSQQNVMLQSATPLYYPTLLSAYQSPGWTTAAFSALAMDFPEGPLTFDRTVTFSIDGGKTAPGFGNSIGGYTTLVGPLTVKSGRVNVQMFRIK
ncbi:MAG: hypothetical protein IPQ16_07555 [Geobacteraceae bacterium]|nr:hypothetical protein [Geobacteraceae bacterium]